METGAPTDWIKLALPLLTVLERPGLFSDSKAFWVAVKEHNLRYYVTIIQIYTKITRFLKYGNLVGSSLTATQFLGVRSKTQGLDARFRVARRDM